MPRPNISWGIGRSILSFDGVFWYGFIAYSFLTTEGKFIIIKFDNQKTKDAKNLVFEMKNRKIEISDDVELQQG